MAKMPAPLSYTEAKATWDRMREAGPVVLTILPNPAYSPGNPFGELSTCLMFSNPDKPLDCAWGQLATEEEAHQLAELLLTGQQPPPEPAARYTPEEVFILDWKSNRLGGFSSTLFDAISLADHRNLERLRAGFPVEVQAFLNYSRTEGWYDRLQAKAQADRGASQ